MADESSPLVKCSNCGHSFEGRYCPQCGVDSKKSPVNFTSFVKETVNSLDIDRGFFKTCLILLIKPGHAIRNYLRGNKQTLYNPMKLVLIVGAIVTLVVFRFDTFAPSVSSEIYMPLKLPDFEGYVYYSGKYFSFFSIASIPLFSLASWFLFKQSHYNFTENLILNLYIAGGQFIINLIYAFLPVIFNYENIEALGILNVGYNVLVLLYFFPGKFFPKFIKSIFAVALPQIAMFFLNYLIYRSVPQGFWEMLDLI